MNREILFRGKRIDNGEWVEGDLIHGVGPKSGKLFILPIAINLASYPGCHPLDGFNVIPETVGQLQYTNKHGRYFDGDIYYHAGYGNEVVNGLCELQFALLTGHDDNIESIIGNIYDK